MQSGAMQNELDLGDKYSNNESSLSNGFTNELIDDLPMPSLAQISQKSISKTYIKANRYLRLATTLIFVMLLSFAWWFAPLQTFITVPTNIRLALLFALFACTFLGGLSILYGALADKRKFYAIREHDISYTCGVFFKKTVSQPVLRIQHVELRRGPIDRKLNLANLQVFSAGGALHTFEIPGLDLIEAQKIRQFILGHKDISHESSHAVSENADSAELESTATKLESTATEIEDADTNDTEATSQDGGYTKAAHQGKKHDE
ncbi:MAG: PH domain-containing protein [Colwellia sp.]